VYMPGELSRAKPPSTTNSKCGAEEETSADEKKSSASSRVLWMFRSPTTRCGMLVSGKSASGGTEGTLPSAEMMD